MQNIWGKIEQNIFPFKYFLFQRSILLLRRCIIFQKKQIKYHTTPLPTVKKYDFKYCFLSENNT